MARIRSVHPEQWTDDRFVECSPLARLLALALRNEADDNGAFEWNPVKIKMRLLPVDNCDVVELLKELEDTRQIFRYSTDEQHQFGLIRNFRSFQKPKKPTYKFPLPTGEVPNCFRFTVPNWEKHHHLIPPEFRTSSPPVPHQFPTSPEPVPPGEEGRGEEEEGKGRGKGEEEHTPEKESRPAKEEEAIPIDAVVGFYNLHCGFDGGIPAVQRWTKSQQRIKHFVARWREQKQPLEWWEGLFKFVAKSDFLMGRAGDFQANFEWIMKPSNFVKVIEGNYANRERQSDPSRGGGSGGHGKLSAADRVAQANQQHLKDWPGR